MKNICITTFLCLVNATWTIIAAQSYFPASHHKYQVASQVCQKIAVAYGSHRLAPQLVIVPNSNPRGIIARFVPKPVPQVWIDEKLYDICRTLGKDSLNALAYIIGHELSHYYRDHGWTESFVGLTSDDPIENGKSEWKKMAEAEADRDGVFYAYSAGYQPYAITTILIKKIYQAYLLPEKMQGYPSRDERIALIVEQAQEAEQYAYLQEVGKFLLLRKDFLASEQCFAAVARSFPSKENWNNLGVSLLSQAADQVENSEMYFAYPFEIDASNRLLHGKSRGGRAETGYSQIQPLLEKAARSFEKAKLLDSIYIPAYVNWACAETLMGNHAFAIGLIDKLNSYLPNLMSGNVSLIRGIARVKMGQIREAETDFSTMRQQNAYQAAYNYTLFDKINRSWLNYLPNWLSHWPTVESWIQQYFINTPIKKNNRLKIENIHELIEEEENTSDTSFEEMIRLPPPFPLHITYHTSEDINRFRIQMKTQQIDLVQINSGSVYRSARGLRAGDRVVDLTSKYGSPSRTVAGNEGRVFYVYGQAGLMAEVLHGRVLKLMIYRTKIL